jgi:replicative DNA helicase|tara:strand:- start:7795 stop:9105 length:1311 start_codon:yes stop_codon:yes gene_type:complete
VSKLDLDYFENILIFKSLTDSGYLASIADIVQPAYFKNKAIAEVFTIIKDFNEKRNKLPTTTELKSYLVTDDQKESFKNLVTSFSDIDKNLDKDELYDNTEQFLKEKAVYHTMLEVAEDVAKGKVDTSIVLDKFEKSCNINLVTDLGLDIHENIDLVINDINSVERHIPSNWEWLDSNLDGGFLEAGKSLYVFAGETNIGKSIFLGNIARNIAGQGKNVLLVTLEMSELLYARRICTNISKIPIREMNTNTALLKQAVEEEPGKIFIKEFPPSTITANQLKAFVKKFSEKGIKLDAIVLDYLNLMHSSIGNNSYERIKHVTEQVRAMSYLFECPIISATQLNRAGFDQDNPDLATISESIGLAATADVIASIYQNEEDRELGIIRLGMMKNRYGPRGTTQAMRIDYSTLTIEQADDIELEDDSSETLGALAALANS